MISDILIFICLLAVLAIAVFFTFPRFMANMQDLFVDLAANLLCKIEDAVEEWKDLFETLRKE